MDLFFISFGLLALVIFPSLVRFFFIKHYFVKIISLYYIINNTIFATLIYFLYSNKFSYMNTIIFILLLINMIIILFFIDTTYRPFEAEDK
jgi:hypothetical protein